MRLQPLWSATIYCRFRRLELIPGVSKTAKNEDAQGKAAINRRAPKRFAPLTLYVSLKNEDAQGKAAINRRTPERFAPLTLYVSL